MPELTYIKNYKVEIILIVLLVFSFFIRLHRLEVPEIYYFDEVYYAFTAQAMAEGNRAGWESSHKAPEGFAYEWTHPPLGKELSALGIMLFGDNTFGWRFFQAIFGGLGTLFIFLLGKNLFNSRGVGLLAAILYTFENFIFVLSRITMIDIFMLNFILLASLFLVKYARTRRNLFLGLTGLCCGAAMSIKWSGVYVTEYLGFVAFCLIYYYEFYSDKSNGTPFVGALLKIAPRMIVAFAVIPLVVYMVTYIPFFWHGNSIGDFFELQNNMYQFHKGVTEDHPYQSAWWKWPLLLKTVYMYVGDFQNKYAHIYGIGNPFIWWSGCVFLLIGVVQTVRKETVALGFAVVSVFAYWLPWAFSPRKVTFLYHFLPSLGFILIIAAYFLNELWQRYKFGKPLVILYVLLAIGTYAYFYPITAALHIPIQAIDNYMWLDSWR